MSHLFPHSRSDAAWCLRASVSPSTKSSEREPRRCRPLSPPPCGEAGPECAPPLTDHQDGQTRCLRWTLQDCPFLGVWGRASCWRPGTLQLGHFLSVPAAPQVALEVPGSLLPRLPHGAEPVRSFVLPLEMFSKEAFVPFPDVGEVWSPGMISSSRKVHPSSHVRVSPCPAMRDPGGVPPGSAALSYFEPDQVLSTW